MQNRNAAVPLNVETMGIDAWEALAGLDGPARVRGAFDNSFYVQVGRLELVRVIRHGEYVSPGAVVAGERDRDFSFRSMGIEEGMEVARAENDILIGGRFAIADMDRVPKWRPPPSPDGAAARPLEVTRLNLRVLRDAIYSCPSREGLVPLLESVEIVGSLEFFLKPRGDSFAERARPHVERMMWGLFSRDAEAVEESAAAVTGLGPGLTPSGDDFLCGLIAGIGTGRDLLNVDDGGFFDEVSGRVYAAAVDKTTIFSLNMLREALEGKSPLAVISLVHSLLTKDASETARAARTLVRMGETSGADIAVGVFYGIRFLLSGLENLEVLHETD